MCADATCRATAATLSSLRAMWEVLMVGVRVGRVDMTEKGFESTT